MMMLFRAVTSMVPRGSSNQLKLNQRFTHLATNVTMAAGVTYSGILALIFVFQRKLIFPGANDDEAAPPGIRLKTSADMTSVF